jgi:hypothetical protein
MTSNWAKFDGADPTGLCVAAAFNLTRACQ